MGVLQVLEDEGIPVMGIAGTSMGGLLGALYASGQTAQVLADEVARFSHPRQVLKLIDVGLTSSGLSVRGARLYELLVEQLRGSTRFEDLRMPFAVVAVDLVTGREVVLSEGSVAHAVRATVSVPGVFEPVSYREMRLIDGGILNNVPVDVGRAMVRRPVVAVDVIPPFPENEAPASRPMVSDGPVPVEAARLRPMLEPGGGPEAADEAEATEKGDARPAPRWPALIAPRLPRFINDASHVRLIMISHMTQRRLAEAPPDLLLRPELPRDVTVLAGFHRTRELIESGRRAALAALPELKRLAGQA